MPPEFEEHLLSAYLDNELSADERALVEQRLNTDPAARQLLEDLRRVRSLVATLPRWQGEDVQWVPPDAQTAADTAPAEVEATLPPTVTEVDYSTDQAEMHLRKQDKPATSRKQRSMRWMSVLAVAAGVGALMLTAPYFLRPGGPIREVAQRTDSAESEAAVGRAEEPAAPMLAPGADGQVADAKDSAAGAQEVAESPRRDADFSRERQSASNTENSPANLPPLNKEKTDAREAQVELHTAEQPGGTAGAERNGRDATTGAGTSRFGDAGAPAPDVASNPARGAAMGLGIEGSEPRPLTQSVPETDSAGARAIAPLSRSLQSSSAMAGGFGGAAAPSAASAATESAQQVVAARSDAWSDQEVDAAMNRVWFFVAPSAGTGSSLAQNWNRAQTGAGMAQAYDYYNFEPTNQAENGFKSDRAFRMRSSDTRRATDEVKSERILEERENVDRTTPSKPPTDTPTSGKLFSSPAAGGVAPKASQPKPEREAPAIGLFRLPADQTADALLDRLQQARSLTRLAPLAETDGTKRLQESSNTGQALAYGAAVPGEPGNASDPRTVVLFVTASEAREILQSLSSDHKPLTLADREAAEAKQSNEQAAQAQQQPKDRSSDAPPAEQAASSDAGQLPAGWWTRPQVFSRQGVDKAPTAGDEKVILILSVLPR